MSKKANCWVLSIQKDISQQSVQNWKEAKKLQGKNKNMIQENNPNPQDGRKKILKFSNSTSFYLLKIKEKCSQEDINKKNK